jgi:hypothetical protein
VLDGEDLATRSGASTTSRIVSETVDGFNVRLPTGPFASRTAGPQGPIAATSESDLTPAVDRHERGLFQEIRGVNDDDAAELIARRFHRAGESRSFTLRDSQESLESDPAEGAVVALRRAGGFPIKVTGSPIGPRADLSALLAFLPAKPDSVRQSSRGRGIRVWIPREQAAVSMEAARSSDRSQSPDYVRAAWGLALGLGLTTGPLFPDLLMAAQARLPKWMRALQVTDRLDAQTMPPRRRFAGFWRWLRSPSASR